MLRITNLTKTYKSHDGAECKAVDDISLTFPQTGFVFIVGKSGSGKSTLLNLLSGMDIASSGEIYIAGKHTHEFTSNDFDIYRNTYVGFIFQDFSLIDSLTIGENIEISIKLQGKKISKENVIDALNKVGLKADYYSRRTNELSGGEKQRIAIARVLIKNPKIIFADEPTGSLDTVTGRQILDLFSELSKDHLVISVSHDMDNALQYSDRIITLSDGKVISDKTKSDEIDVLNLKKEYLEKIDNSFIDTVPIDSEQNSFIRTSTHIPFRQVSKIVLENFKKKKIHFVLTVFLSIIALLIFTLANIMNNYDAHNASLMTFEKLDINTLLLTNTKEKEDTEISFTGFNSFIADTREATIFSDKFTFELESSLSGVMRAYHLSDIYIPTLERIGRRNQVYSSNISKFVEVDNIENFYNTKLTYGRLPKFNINAIEILVSDYTAECLMRFGGRFYANDIVYPNTNYDKVLDKILEINLIAFKIVGIFDTDYEKVLAGYNSTDERINDNFTAKFNIPNIYCVALTQKNAIYKHLEKLPLVNTQIYISTSASEDNTNAEEKNTYIRSQSKIGSSFTSAIFFKDGYSNESLIEDTDVVLPYSYVKDQLNGISFDELTTELLNNLIFNIHVFDETCDPLFTNPNVIAVYNDTNTRSNSVIYLSENKKLSAIRDSLIISNLYIPIDDNKKNNESLLSYLDNNNLWYLTYASGELKTFNALFLYLSDLLSWITIVMFVFVLILIYSFVSAGIRAKTKEIGILRAMGARGVDIAKIFSIESAIIFIIQTLFSFLLTGVGVLCLNSLLTNEFTNTLTLLKVTPLSLWLLSIVSFISVSLASTIPLLRLIKMKPADAMRITE
ncbi:MAG: ATP-binding cassette domain-containing protein [Christensenellaceae bacterium]|jgi:ABC-type lipoprotein export system ATPase subunit/ABC-type antimicrobial peptide transport system permease subunit|nr:ATP-binding cassette domain-containing protein [Christensenellaceae bacterium]